MPPAGVPGRPGAAGSGGAAPATASSAGFNFDASRWTTADKITGIASVVLLISLFLEWFSVSASVNGLTVGGYSGSGVAAHGYLYLVFFICLAIIAVEVMKAGFAEMPFKLPMSIEQLLLIATVINLVVVVLAFLLKPGAGVAFSGVHVSWAFGAFVSLIAALAAAAPLVVPAIQARSKK
jgi:hypothetical protein